MLAESVIRLVATLLAMAQTRMELVAAEVQEESLRYFSYLLWSLAAMFCLGIAIVAAVLLVVVLYWDTHRIGILLTLSVLFGITGVAIGLRLHRQYRGKPQLLAYSTSVLSRDAEMLQPHP